MNDFAVATSIPALAALLRLGPRLLLLALPLQPAVLELERMDAAVVLQQPLVVRAHLLLGRREPLHVLEGQALPAALEGVLGGGEAHDGVGLLLQLVRHGGEEDADGEHEGAVVPHPAQQLEARRGQIVGLVRLVELAAVVDVIVHVADGEERQRGGRTWALAVTA